MAVGLSKSKWNSGVPEGHINGGSVDLQYAHKLSISDILKFEPCKYEYIIENKDTKNSLWFGDNLKVFPLLAYKFNLLNMFQLIYIDPPFATKSVFKTRGDSNDAYTDTLHGASYIEFMRRRLVWLRELLSDQGIIFLHVDQNMVFQLKIVLDELFGESNFLNMITRQKCPPKNYTRKSFGNISDHILVYSKTKNYKWNRSYKDWPEEKIETEYPYIDEKGRRYKRVPIHAPGTRNGETGKSWRGMMPPSGKHWQYKPSKLEELDKAGHIYWSRNGNPRRKVYFKESRGIAVQDIWLDTIDPKNQNTKITGYPTEKNINLIKRVILAGSDKGDMVLDAFSGSGTTLQAAEETKRNWIGIDDSIEAIKASIKRFEGKMEKMGDFVASTKKITDQQRLFENNTIKFNLIDITGKLGKK